MIESYKFNFLIDLKFFFFFFKFCCYSGTCSANDGLTKENAPAPGTCLQNSRVVSRVIWHIFLMLQLIRGPPALFTDVPTCTNVLYYITFM